MNASVKQLPKLKKKLLTTQQSQLPNNKLGRRGELQAQEFLTKNGFQVIDVNVRCGNEEIDIIAIDQKLQELVFVEVKTRSTAFYGNPSLAVGKRKLQNLIKVAQIFRTQKRIWLDYRFDVIAILPDSVEHFKNVSW